MDEVDGPGWDVVVLHERNSADLDGLVATLDRGGELASSKPPLSNHALHELLSKPRSGEHEEVLRTGHGVLTGAARDPLDQVPDVRLSWLIDIWGVGAGDELGCIPDRESSAVDAVQVVVSTTTVGDVDQPVHGIVVGVILSGSLYNNVGRKHAGDTSTCKRERGVVTGNGDVDDLSTATEGRTSHITNSDVVTNRQEQGSLTSASNTIRSRHDDGGVVGYGPNESHDTVSLVVQRLLHEERRSVLDFLHRLLGDGGESSFLALRSNEREPVDLTGGVGANNTNVTLPLSSGGVRREEPAGRERSA